MTASDAVDPKADAAVVKAAKDARRRKYGIIVIAELAVTFLVLWPSFWLGQLFVLAILAGALYVTYTFYKKGSAAKAHLAGQALRARNELSKKRRGDS